MLMVKIYFRLTIRTFFSLFCGQLLNEHGKIDKDKQLNDMPQANVIITRFSDQRNKNRATCKNNGKRNHCKQKRNTDLFKNISIDNFEHKKPSQAT